LKIGSSIVLPKNVQVKNQNVEIGISNETMTEIVSGLKEGDIVISSKISSQTQTQSTQNQFRLQIPGMTSPQRR
jgi:multidrug efflux pump subunit AcrA (membrane-fusion protein)